jgi:hypothetical protein
VVIVTLLEPEGVEDSRVVESDLEAVDSNCEVFFAANLLRNSLVR